MAVSSQGGHLRPPLFWVSPRSRSIRMVWSLQPRFRSSAAENWKVPLFLKSERGLSHNDESLTEVVESKQRGLLLATRRWADLDRCIQPFFVSDVWQDCVSSAHFLPPTKLGAPWTATRSKAYAGARAVRYSDKSIWHRVTLEVKNSKKRFRQGPQCVVDIESSLPKNYAQNSLLDFRDGRTNSVFSGISCAPTTPSIRATTSDVKASFSQVKEQTSDELDKPDAEKAYCKEGKVWRAAK